MAGCLLLQLVSSLFDFSVSCLGGVGYGCYLRFVCLVCFGLGLTVFVCVLFFCGWFWVFRLGWLNCLIVLWLLCVAICVGVIVMICNMVLCEHLLNVGYYLFRLLVDYLGFVLIVLMILLLLLVTRCLCVNILLGWCYLFLFVGFVVCFVLILFGLLL